MPSVKKLKKELKNIALNLMSECETYGYFHPEISAEDIDEINRKIIAKHKEIIYEINHLKYAGDVKPKEYYQDVIKKVNSELVTLLDEISKIEK